MKCGSAVRMPWQTGVVTGQLYHALQVTINTYCDLLRDVSLL